MTPKSRRPLLIPSSSEDEDEDEEDDGAIFSSPDQQLEAEEGVKAHKQKKSKPKVLLRLL